MFRKEKKMDIKPQFITQGHHCGYYWHLMANAMLLGTSRAHTARLLGKSPSAWLKAPSSSPAVWSSVVVLSPQYLCHQQPLLSLLGWAKWGKHGRKGWEINAKTTQLLGNQLWVEAQSPLWDSEDSVYFLSISWAPKWGFTHTCASHSLHLGQRPSAKVASDKGQVMGQGWATSKGPQKRI